MIYGILRDVTRVSGTQNKQYLHTSPWAVREMLPSFIINSSIFLVKESTKFNVSYLL